MLDFATLANNHLEKKLAKGELKIIKEKKQPTLDGMDELDITRKMFCLQHRLCMTCMKRMKVKLNGDAYCTNKRTKCNSFRLKATRDKFEI